MVRRASIVKPGVKGGLPSTLYPLTNVPLLKGALKLAYMLSGRIFCWNSSIATVGDILVTLLPTNNGSGSTNCGMFAPGRGVWDSWTEAKERPARVGMYIPALIAPAATPSLINCLRVVIKIELLSE